MSGAFPGRPGAQGPGTAPAPGIASLPRWPPHAPLEPPDLPGRAREWAAGPWRRRDRVRAQQHGPHRHRPSSSKAYCVQSPDRGGVGAPTVCRTLSEQPTVCGLAPTCQRARADFHPCRTYCVQDPPCAVPLLRENSHVCRPPSAYKYPQREDVFMRANTYCAWHQGGAGTSCAQAQTRSRIPICEEVPSFQILSSVQVPTCEYKILMHAHLCSGAPCVIITSVQPVPSSNAPCADRSHQWI